MFENYDADRSKLTKTSDPLPSFMGDGAAQPTERAGIPRGLWRACRESAASTMLRTAIPRKNPAHRISIAFNANVILRP